MRQLIFLLAVLILLVGCAQENPNTSKTYVVDEREGIPMETAVVGDPSSEETNLGRFQRWQEEKEARDKLEWREKGLHNEVEDNFITFIGKGEDALNQGNIEDAKTYIKEAEKLVAQNDFLEDTNAYNQLDDLREAVDRKD